MTIVLGILPSAGNWTGHMEVNHQKKEATTVTSDDTGMLMEGRQKSTQTGDD